MTREESMVSLKDDIRAMSEYFTHDTYCCGIREVKNEMNKIYAIEFWDSTDQQYYVSTRYVFLTYKDAHDVLENTAHRYGQVVEIPIYRSKED